MKTNYPPPLVRAATVAVACLLLSGASVSAQSARLDDTFADGERATQNLPASAAWYTSAAGTALTVVSQALVFPGDAATAQHIVTYFTPSGSPQTLGVGDTLTASFNFTPTTPIDASSGWRIGIFNSGGSRVTADNLTNAHVNYNAWTGYAAMVNPGSTGGAQFWKRNVASNTLIASTSGYTALGSTGASQVFSTGTTYTCVITATRTASGVDLALSFTGGALSNYVLTVSDTTSAFTSFDAFAMSINRNGTTPAFASLTLDNAYVAYSPLLDDQFADSERATQNFPTSAAWITSAVGTSLTVSGEQLVFPGDTTGPQHIVTYFTPSGTPKTIGVNERLTASFTFKVASPIDVAAGWRLGVFNSGGSRVTTDAQTTAHANFNAWTGYAAFVSPGGTSNAQLWKRTGTSTTLLVSSAPFTALGSPIASQAFTAGTTYTGNLTLSRTSGGIDLSLKFTGGAISSYVLSTSDASPVTSFDSLAMTINRSGTTPSVASLTLDNVVVEHGYIKALTVTGITASDKTYDSTTAATINTGSAVLSGVTAGDTVTLGTSGASGAFVTETVGTGKIVNIAGLTLGGADAGKYYLTQPTATATITAKTVTVTGVTAADKVYDATTAATINTGGAVITGLVGGDTVTLNAVAATGAFASATVGTAKSVTITGLSLSGTDAANYVLTQPTATASITAKALTVTGITAEDKVYDATTAATIDVTAAALEGILGADVVTLQTGPAAGTFASGSAGVAKTVTITGLSLSGTEVGNYALPVPQATATADIATRDLAVTGITANNKAYDGTTVATLNTAGATLNGVLGGDTVTLNTASAVGTFSDSAAGLNKIVTITGLTISGASAVNYTVSQPSTTADITSGGSGILSDSFTDAERATQSLPNSAAWYTSAVASGLTVSNQNLVFAGDGLAPQHIVAYFTPSGSPQAIAVGGSLTLAFTFTPTSPIDLARGWRFGLFNSGGNRVTADNLTTSHANYTNWTGYAAWINPLANASGVEIAERTAASTNLITGQSAYTILGGATASQTLAAGTTYSGTFSVARTSSGITLTVSLSGGSLSNYTLTTQDTSPASTSFDAIAMSINRQSTPTTVPAFGTLSLDDVTVTAGTAPPTNGPVLTPYEMLGNPMFGCTQGDLSESRATKYTFTVMKSGRLYRIAVQTQGLRPNAEWGDAHAKGNGGSYHVRIYSPAAGGSVASTGGSPSGNPQGNMTLLGSTQNAWYPGKTNGSFQAPTNSWTLETGKGSDYLANQSIPSTISEYVGGAQVQSWLVRARSTEAVVGTPPSGFLGTSRAQGTSIVYVELYDTTGAYGIAVTQGQVLCVSHENQDGSPTSNYSHNNEAHAGYAPLPGYGISTPLDPAAGVFFNAGNRDWRKMPHFSALIDDTWYGQPVYIRDGNNVTDDDLTKDGAARLMYGARYSRQIITPPAGYNRTMNTLWINAARFTGKSGYTDSGGQLQVRILRTPVGTTTWTQVWPSSGWSTFAAGTFGAHSTVITGGSPPTGSGQITAPADLAKLVKYGSKTLSPSLAVTGSYTYAIEVRVDPTTPNSAFYLAATYSPEYIYNRDRPPGRAAIAFPNWLPYGSSGQTYNRAEISGDSGSTWESFRRRVPGNEQPASTSIRVFPIALQPDPI